MTSRVERSAEYNIKGMMMLSEPAYDPDFLKQRECIEGNHLNGLALQGGRQTDGSYIEFCNECGLVMYYRDPPTPYQKITERKLALVRKEAHFWLNSQRPTDLAEYDKAFQEMLDLIDGKSEQLNWEVDPLTGGLKHVGNQS